MLDENKKCENCDNDHNGEYGSGRFCTSKCARGFSTKDKRSLINEKVSLKMKNRESISKGIVKSDKSNLNFRINEKRICLVCNNEYIALFTNSKYCTPGCSYKRDVSDETKEKISKIKKEQCNTIEERNRLKEIGRKGGYGKKGYTNNGIYYQSTLEQKCFEYLMDLNILFEPHKNLPNDVRETDIWLLNSNIWIELDGINREKKKKYLGKNYDKWIEKLNLYKELNLNLKIIYTYDEFKEFIKFINKMRD